MKLNPTALLLACSLVTGATLDGLAADPDSTSIAGVYVVFSTDQEDAGKALVLPIGVGKDTVTITWELLGSEPYSGVGIIKGDNLSAAWFGGVCVYEIDVDDDDVKLNGTYVQLDAPGEKHNETMLRVRKFTPQQLAERLEEANQESEDGQFEQDEIVAAYWSGDDGFWYYAKIVEKHGEKYLVDYLAGDVESELRSASQLSQYHVGVGDEIESTLEGEEEEGFWELTVKSVPADWTKLSADDEVTLNDEQQQTYIRPLKALRFKISE